MATELNYLVLIAPFAVIALITRQAHRDGHLRWRMDQFRISAPMMGRIGHDRDAVRTRFEEHPSWPEPGVLGERR